MTCVHLIIQLTVSIKVFDRVPHNILLNKLWYIGINNNLWSWFQCYLTNRFQRVTINHCLSDPLPIKSGVLQGSILGLLFFIIYINDLPISIRHSRILNFADDIVIHNALDMASLQLDLNSLTKRSTENQLSFNINKCTAL